MGRTWNQWSCPVAYRTGTDWSQYRTVLRTGTNCTLVEINRRPEGLIGGGSAFPVNPYSLVQGVKTWNPLKNMAKGPQNPLKPVDPPRPLVKVGPN